MDLKYSMTYQKVNPLYSYQFVAIGDGQANSKYVSVDNVKLFLPLSVITVAHFALHLLQMFMRLWNRFFLGSLGVFDW